MNRPERPRAARAREIPTLLLWGARGLALAAAGICGYLLRLAMAGGQAAGCGHAAGAGCGHVLDGRWSEWLGVPVSLPGLVAYALTFLGLMAVGPRASASAKRISWRVMLALAPLLIGAAGWFIALQVATRSYCAYCLTTHASGILIAVFILAYGPVAWRPAGGSRRAGTTAMAGRTAWSLMFVGLAGVLLTVAGQMLRAPDRGMQIVDGPPPGGDGIRHDEEPPDPGPVAVVTAADPDVRPAQPKPEATATAGAGAPASASASIPAAPTAARPHRGVPILRGRFALDADEHPCLGPREAEFVLVEMFDYTCGQCRTMHDYLSRARERYGDRLALLLVPVPLHSACNPHVAGDRPEHERACELARLALAVWKASPGAFEGLHRWLLEREGPPTLPEARAEADRLVGDAALADALADPGTNLLLEEGVRLYGAIGGGQIPRLFAERTFAVGAPRNAEALFQFLEQRVGLQPPPP